VSNLEEQTNQPEEQQEEGIKAIAIEIEGPVAQHSPPAPGAGSLPAYLQPEQTAEEVLEPEPEGEPVSEELADWDELLGEADLVAVYVALPAPYRGGIKVRPMTMHEIKAARAASKKRIRLPGNIVQTEIDNDQLTKRFVLMSVVEPILTPEKYDALNQKSWPLLQAIVDGVNQVNGFTKEPVAIEQAVEAEF
jgi:hypothetical protein